MTSWEDQFNELKNQFMTRSGARITEINDLLQALTNKPEDQSLLRQISQHFHWLAGSGGTYGFEEVTAWGLYGEELCDYFLKLGNPLQPSDIEQLSKALQTVQQLFASIEPPMDIPTGNTLPPVSSQDALIAPPKTAPVSDTINTYNDPMPVVAAAAATPIPVLAQANVQAKAAGKPIVVLVDGNLTNLGILKQELESQGFYAESFSTISATRTLFEQTLPHAVIVSVPLPDGSGYELIEQLRAGEGGHKPVVLVVGQQSGFLDKVKSIRSGADAFFEYPADPQEIIKHLQYLLDRDKPEQYKILSVEDDPDQAGFIKLTLESAGYTVEHLGDPKRFEEIFLAFEPDLVLLDVMLGDMTGFDIARYIRQHTRFATVPIIFLTTQNKLHMHIRSARAGSDDHLVKPVAPQLLIATIAGRLEKSRAVKRLIDRDGLTRCLSYGNFMEKANKLATAQVPRNQPALMMIDIDNLKQINERFGYAVGDRIISHIGGLLLKGFRNTELIARYGSDQFAVILDNLDILQLQNIASQVIGAIAGNQHMAQGTTFAVTCSSGVSMLEPGMTLQDWLNHSEKALQVAKGQGKNRAIVKPLERASSGSRH